MKVFHDLEFNANLSLALGFFDGVHLAHQKVIVSAVDFAKKNNTKSAVITFKEHPLCYLKNFSANYILTRSDSYKIIENLGIDYLFELDFSKISSLSAKEYLENILVKYFKPAGIFTGFNHTFGANREGNSDFLKKFQKVYNYEYHEVPAIIINNKIISSSAIRNYIKKGELENANLMLGQEFKISGRVIEGNKIGRTIGFPTANIIYPQNIIQMPYGAYFVKVSLNNKIYSGIANYGVRPTIDKDLRSLIEVNVFDFDNNIYNENIEIFFIKFIRPEQKFIDLDKLKEQIEKDVCKCKSFMH